MQKLLMLSSLNLQCGCCVGSCCLGPDAFWCIV